ncbi:hypothetical protein GCM10009416_46760 [Craurococcus roseus]|uniref:HTH tetR-type domain-containing protein n=1 Tax=Craurococcus roseus TaxID=77585 RepID=A0ABN1G490_9PROT
MPQPSTDTRTRLVEAAIRLFAARGVHGVSLRGVGEAAGARNTAAVHYHFKSREALLEAALDHVLAALRAPGGAAGPAGRVPRYPAPEDPVAGIVAAVFMPLLSLDLLQPRWGRDGQRLLARVAIGDGGDLAVAFDDRTAVDADAAVDALSAHIPGIGTDELRRRVDLAAVLVMAAAAGSAPGAAAPRGRGAGTGTRADWTASLLAMVAAGLTAGGGGPSGPPQRDRGASTPPGSAKPSRRRQSR